MFDFSIFAEFLKVLPLMILGFTASIATAYAFRYRAETRIMRAHVAWMEEHHEKLVQSTLEQIDLRTKGALRYEFVRTLLGPHEAAIHHIYAMRIAGKLGLQPGYYCVDDNGLVTYVTSDHPAYRGAYADSSSGTRSTSSSNGGSRRPKTRPEISASKRFDIMRRDNFRCQLCGRVASDDAILQIDHKVPVAKGGTNDDSNLWTLCSDCNLAKSDTLMPEILGGDANKKGEGE